MQTNTVVKALNKPMTAYVGTQSIKIIGSETHEDGSRTVHLANCSVFGSSLEAAGTIHVDPSTSFEILPEDYYPRKTDRC